MRKGCSENFLKWMHVLKSGKYEENIGFCMNWKEKRTPLGVACDLYRKMTGKGRWDKDFDYGNLFVVGRGNPMECFLPSAVAKHFGVSVQPSVKFSHLSVEEKKKVAPYQRVNGWVHIPDLALLGFSHPRIAELLEASNPV